MALTIDSRYLSPPPGMRSINVATAEHEGPEQNSDGEERELAKGPQGLRFVTGSQLGGWERRLYRENLLRK